MLVTHPIAPASLFVRPMGLDCIGLIAPSETCGSPPGNVLGLNPLVDPRIIPESHDLLDSLLLLVSL